MSTYLPLVSICCTAYNHEKYIERALKGMLSQKTSFSFEIIVHDDASTDGTAEIIRKYTELHPDIIRPIYQKTNQYSQKVNISKEYLYPLCRGKYIALCEGDDYWIDNYKLQVQSDVMEREPNCQMCTHAFRNVIANSKQILDDNHTLDHDGWLDPGLIIENIQAPQTATFLFRKSILEHYPEFFYDLEVGDYPKRVYCAISGGIYYIDRVMSCYRKYADCSWTSTMIKNTEHYALHIQKMIAFCKNLDTYTAKRYHENIENRIDHCNYLLYIKQNQVRKAMRTKYFRHFSFQKKCGSLFRIKFPKIWIRISKIKNLSTKRSK